MNPHIIAALQDTMLIDYLKSELTQQLYKDTIEMRNQENHH